MSPKPDLKLKNRPDNLRYFKAEVRFKLDESDLNKSFDEVLKIDDSGVLLHLSEHSYHNGLIMGDQILKINGSSMRNKSDLNPLWKGSSVSIEVSRREGASVVTKERLRKSNFGISQGYALMVINFTRPPNVSPTAKLGVTFKTIKNRALVTEIESGGVLQSVLAVGDWIIDFDGSGIHFSDAVAVREEMAKFQKTGKLNILIERPATPQNLKDMRKYINSITPTENDISIAPDVKKIGLEASNMHFLIFKKLCPPSILKTDIERNKMNRTRTVEGKDQDNVAKIRISAASTEMRIDSDVEDEDDLKDVVKKSHAASGTSGVFDDE